VTGGQTHVKSGGHFIQGVVTLMIPSLPFIIVATSHHHPDIPLRAPICRPAVGVVIAAPPPRRSRMYSQVKEILLLALYPHVTHIAERPPASVPFAEAPGIAVSFRWVETAKVFLLDT
jgi:hypothetical protein